MNLVSNSIKFTSVGSVCVRTSFRSLPEIQDGGEFHIAVEDQGIGMDAQTQEKIFEAFTQADASTTREYGGTGLGLAISHNYIELMGGKIFVDSLPGEGTRISLSIPTEIVSRDTQKSYEDISIVARVHCSDETTREMCTSHLYRLGIPSTSIEQMSQLEELRDLYVIDSEATDAELVGGKTQDILNGQRGIVLTPFGEATIPAKLSGWLKVTKPLTLNSLKSAIDAIYGELYSESVQNMDGGFQTTNRNRKRILVAEDMETNQNIAREMIQMLGHTVDIANNGKEAVESFFDKRHDLIFMDCQMPVMDGYEGTLKIREIERTMNFQPVPIVALTAGFNEQDRERCRFVGMNHYLSKPFSIADIKKTLAKYLGQKFPEEINWKLEVPKADSTNLAKAPIGGNQAIVNSAAIENILEVERQTGNSILASIFDGFVDQMDEKLEEIQLNCSNMDNRSVYRSAHAIKSMSANIGAEKVRSISAEIESVGRNNNLADIDAKLDKLKVAYSEFVDHFKSVYLG
jgi:CheY-like chemotaxis protein/HPt (histidine-containing phosphotransfer) domain-containing protein